MDHMSTTRQFAHKSNFMYKEEEIDCRSEIVLLYLEMHPQGFLNYENIERADHSYFPYPHPQFSL